MTGSKRTQAQLLELADHHQQFAAALRIAVAALVESEGGRRARLGALAKALHLRVEATNGHGPMPATDAPPKKKRGRPKKDATPTRKRRPMTAAAKARISKAQKKRWKKWHATKKADAAAAR